MSKGLIGEEELSKLLMDFNVKDYEVAGNSKNTADASSSKNIVNSGIQTNNGHQRDTVDHGKTVNAGVSRKTANNENPVNRNQKGSFQTVLVIDDMSSVINSVYSILKDKYKVIGVTSVNMAWDFLKVRHADLVLLDISMPDGNGISFARALKNREATCHIPIVFLTGNATQKSVIEALTAGGTDYIIKPVNENVLLSKLGKILG